MSKNNMLRVAEILQNARKEKNLTLDDIGKKTKIRSKYLKAIEEEKWDLLPGIAYMKGFLKRYADAVELDGDKLLTLFRREFKDEQKVKVIPEGVADEEKGNKFFLTIKQIISKIFSI